MVLETLFPKLVSKGILYKCYLAHKKIILEIGRSYVSNYSKVSYRLDMISGNQMIKPELRYEITDDDLIRFIKLLDTGRISYIDKKYIEDSINSIYEFQYTHEVTKYE